MSRPGDTDNASVQGLRGVALGVMVRGVEVNSGSDCPDMFTKGDDSVSLDFSESLYFLISSPLISC